jgi:hypothetical protein
MNNNKGITENIQVDIGEASPLAIIDYGHYCNDKISINEMPLSFKDWQITNDETLH